MSKYKCSKTEQEINNVMKYQSEELKNIHFPTEEMESSIAKSQKLLEELGYSTIKTCENTIAHERLPINNQSWEELCAEAERHVGDNCTLESIFTEEELKSNENAIRLLRSEFNSLHKLVDRHVDI